jgi:hypothetical protein
VIILWLLVGGLRAGAAAVLEIWNGGSAGIAALLGFSALVSILGAVAVYRRRRGAFPFVAALAATLLLVVLVRQHATTTLAVLGVTGLLVIAGGGVLSMLRRGAR